MPKIMSTGRQFIVTLPKELISLMKWKKGTEVLISKFPEKRILFIEEVSSNGKNNKE